MRKATVIHAETADRVALIYHKKDQAGTVIEIPIKTTAGVGDRVRLPELCAERTVKVSRYVVGVKVIHLSAREWRWLRGLEDCDSATLTQARDVTPQRETQKATAKHGKQPGRTRSDMPLSDRKL